MNVDPTGSGSTSLLKQKKDRFVVNFGTLSNKETMAMNWVSVFNCQVDHSIIYYWPPNNVCPYVTGLTIKIKFLIQPFYHGSEDFLHLVLSK